jgi:hypothetical protein
MYGIESPPVVAYNSIHNDVHISLDSAVSTSTFLIRLILPGGFAYSKVLWPNIVFKEWMHPFSNLAASFKWTMDALTSVNLTCRSSRSQHTCPWRSQHSCVQPRLNILQCCDNIKMNTFWVVQTWKKSVIEYIEQFSTNQTWRSCRSLHKKSKTCHWRRCATYNSWKGEKVSVQNDVAVRIAVYFETLLENPTEQEQVVNQRDTNSDHGSNLPTASEHRKRYLWTWVIYRRKCIWWLKTMSIVSANAGDSPR